MPVTGLRKKPSDRSTDTPDIDEPMNGSTRPASALNSHSKQLLRPDAANIPPRAASANDNHADAKERPTSAGIVSASFDQTRRNRFSLMRFKSDSHLRSTYTQQADGGPPVPAQKEDHTPETAPAPVIGITAPPSEPLQETPKKQKNRLRPLFRSRLTTSKTARSGSPDRPRHSRSHLSFDLGSNSRGAASSNGSINDMETTSNTSRGESSDLRLREATSESQLPKSGTSSNLFKFNRRNKKKKTGGLFPLPAELDPAQNSQLGSTQSNSAQPSPSFASRANSNGQAADGASDGARVSTSTTGRPAQMFRNASSTSGRSLHSASYTNLAGLQQRRSRTSTMKSFPGHPEWDRVPTPAQDSGRNSTASTTIGRNSIAGLRNFTSRFRGPGDSNSPRSGGNTTPIASNTNSFALSRETLVVPEREEGETAGKYYSRLEKDYPKKGIASIFSKSNDQFAHDVLRSLMRTFKFYEEPMDMSLRRFLWEIDLPNEAQQIDRVISAFAERYHECNPHIFGSVDDSYLIAYSLLMLHSDLFNKNNKRKMQRHEYQKNTKAAGINDEILGYFYDNIQYTEFIAQNNDDDESDKKLKSGPRASAKRVGGKIGEVERARPVSRDPYDAIISDSRKLDILRPALREVLNLEESFSYFGTAGRLNLHRLRATFSNYGILQIVSARSRPDAFADPSTTTNPIEAHAGVVDIKVVKVGTLWRKDAKKKKTRSPWQEWGAILTSSQLYFCKNASWVKGLASQYEQHQKQGNRSRPVVFKPPLEQFVHEAQVATTNAVALLDTNYKRHKHAFVLARRGDHWTERQADRYFEEVLLADTDEEMNDWMAKLNYAATFMTANVNVPVANLEDTLSDTNGEDTQSEVASEAPETATESASPSAPVAIKGLRQVSQDTDDNGSAQERPILNGDPRLYMLKRKVDEMDMTLNISKVRLDEQLKTARHLEILAPFPGKTRGELLTFGARMSHNIRWSRYDFWRSKCQRDILLRELELASEGNGSIIAVADQGSQAPKSPGSSAPSGISRLSSKASMLPPRQLSSSRLVNEQQQKRLSQASFSGSHRTSLIAAGLDQVFATPMDAVGRGGSQDENGPFKLPPLGLGVGASSSAQREAPSEIDRILSEHRRQGSVSTAISSTGPSEDADATEAVQSPAADENLVTPRPSTQAEKAFEPDSEKEGNAKSTSPPSRPSARRSLQRTLRDRESSSPSRPRRSRKHRESATSSNGVEDASLLQDSEGLSRRPGSFKLHGKKASVITLGTEWQQLSPEELLRQRKALQQSEAKAKESSNGSPNPSGTSYFTATRPADGDHEPSDASADPTASDYATGDEQVDSSVEQH